MLCGKGLHTYTVAQLHIKPQGQRWRTPWLERTRGEQRKSIIFAGAKNGVRRQGAMAAPPG
jgi:hypothetical protein